MNYKAGWGFKPIEEIKEYYERTGMIVVSNWALTKYDFEREILRFEGIVNHQNTDQFKQTVTADDVKRIKRRNQEYLHRLYTIKFELDL